MLHVRAKRLLLVALTAGFAGCGPSRNTEYVRSSNDSNIKKMASAYQLYASRHGYVGPKSKEELQAFLVDNEGIAKNLELMSIDRSRIDEYFVSENDGEEFHIRWGTFVNPDLERSKEPLVFERTGKNNVRLVILSNRKILEVTDEANFQALLKGRVTVAEAKTDLQIAEEASMAE